MHNTEMTAAELLRTLKKDALRLSKEDKEMVRNQLYHWLRTAQTDAISDEIPVRQEIDACAAAACL